MNRLLLPLILLTLFSLSACQTRVSAVPTATRGVPTPITNPDDLMNQDLFEGFYSFGFETSAFTPCGVKEHWWVGPANDEVGQELVRAREAAASGKEGAVYARLRGKITPEGSYGHLGFYAREFTVSEIVDLRAQQAGDCQ
ncbi:MAG: hypothetical protein IT331_19680 [Anaerolineae bacterium]|nr:hypothetical protein [Anaerolineae bacterium]